MKSYNCLREWAKFFTGLVAADFLTGLWFYFSGSLPAKVMGMTITKELDEIGIIFDFILILILVHYAWYVRIPSPSLGKKKFFAIVGVLLGLVAVLHLLRLVFGTEIDFGTWVMPTWLSWVGVIVTGYLSYASFKFSIQK